MEMYRLIVRERHFILRHPGAYHSFLPACILICPSESPA